MSDLVRQNTLYRMGYQAGHENTIARYNAVIAPAMHQVTLGLTNLVGVIERIGEVAMIGTFRPDYMLSRFELLSPELAERGTQLMIAVEQVPGDHPIKIDKIIGLVSEVQDLIIQAFRGDKGDALRAYMIDLNITTSIDLDLGGRPDGMEPETCWLAERVLYLRKTRKRFFLYRVGLTIYEELIAAPRLKTEEKAALDLLSVHIEKDDLGKYRVISNDALSTYLSNLINRYKKIHQKGVTGEKIITRVG